MNKELQEHTLRACYNNRITRVLHMQISPQIKAAILIIIVGSVIFAASLAVWLFAPKDWKSLAYLLGPSLAAAAVFLDRYFKIL